ncbi:MAG TPA: EVE domain-containing protein [Gemmatimonadaceae bacterium]|jgi:predicted RNA-binding protein with PUA-like domain|nr:EVE domain-containing protein [Gemmatimonadaceae bacterium]
MTKVTRAAHRDRHYWLLKSEPDSFSFDDLWNAPNRATHWDGVRNYQARNYMRDEMKKGDLAFFYHSGAEPGIVGIVEITREGYPDHTAVDPKDPHYDPRSKPGESSWSMVDIHAIERFSRPIALSELRQKPELEGMPLLQKGNRLSVQKVGAAEWNAVTALAKQAPGV